MASQKTPDKYLWGRDLGSDESRMLGAFVFPIKQYDPSIDLLPVYGERFRVFDDAFFAIVEYDKTSYAALLRPHPLNKGVNHLDHRLKITYRQISRQGDFDWRCKCVSDVLEQLVYDSGHYRRNLPGQISKPCWDSTQIRYFVRWAAEIIVPHVFFSCWGDHA